MCLVQCTVCRPFCAIVCSLVKKCKSRVVLFAQYGGVQCNAVQSVQRCPFFLRFNALYIALCSFTLISSAALPFFVRYNVWYCLV